MKFTILLKQAYWLCPVLIFCFAENIGFGQEFQVEGNISIAKWDSAGKPMPIKSSEFNLCVSNCVWELTITPADKIGGDYQKLTFDGTQLYCFNDIETSVANLKKSGQPTGNNLAEAAVVNMEVPHFLPADGAGQVWLSYASGCYFKNITNDFLELPWIFRFKNGYPTLMKVSDSVQLHSKWKLQQDAPQLPENVAYLADIGKFTNAQYTAHSYTNFQNLTLPMESVFDVYTPDRQSISRYTIKAAAFEKLSKAFVFPPPVSAVTIVTDHRFNSLTNKAPDVPVPYFVSDRFLTKEEAKNSSNYMEFKSRVGPADALARIPPTTKRGRAIVVGVMAVSTLIFLTLLVRSMRKDKNKPNGK